MTQVAPHAGAWIETEKREHHINDLIVAPHAGAWIETLAHPRAQTLYHVAPHAGAWIETTDTISKVSVKSRSPRGSVD